MNIARRPIMASAAALSVLLVTACGSTSGSDDETSGGLSGSVSIGVVLEQTGSLATIADPALKGIQLAADEVNKSGGVNGKKLELIVKDATADASVAAAAARDLSTKVPAVIGGGAGAACRAMQPILAQRQVLQYCLSSQSFDLTPQFFWSLSPINKYPDAIVPWLRSKNIKTVGFIGTADSSGDGYLSLFQGIVSASPNEFKFATQQRFDSGTTNVETQMTKLRDAGPDLVVVGTSGTNVVAVLNAMNALGMSQPVYVGTGSATIEALAPAKNLPSGGVYASAYWINLPDDVPTSLSYGQQVKDFAAAYSSKYKAPANSTAAGAYDALMQIVTAMKTGATTGAKIASYLETHQPTGILGPYEISATRHQGATVPHIMMQYSDGRFKLGYSDPATK